MLDDIVGAGAPVPKLISDDPAHLAVTPPRTSSPSTFELVPPSTLEPSTIPAAHGVVHLTADTTPLSGAAAPRAVLKTTVTFAPGPDEALWFTESYYSANKIGRITTDGTVTNEYAVPTKRSEPESIVAGPDGALWFTEAGANEIGRLQ